VSGVQRQTSNATAIEKTGSESSSSQNELLPGRLGNSWRHSGSIITINSEKFSDFPDADIHAEYGLRRIIKRPYTDGKSRLSIDIFEMNYVSGAYGLFTYNRSKREPGSLEFYQGRYLVRISSGSTNTDPAHVMNDSLATAIKSNMTGEEGEFPRLPSHLPNQDKIADSEIYVIGPAVLSRVNHLQEFKDIIDFEGGAEVVTADYRNGKDVMKLIIVEYHTPQSSSFGYEKFQDAYNSLIDSEKNRRVIKRIGNYIVLALNVDDIQAAQNIVGQIKYEARIYWAGRNIGDIPIQFRPPDTVAIEEAKRTTIVVIRSFYWIGAMLLSAILIGIIAGGSLFYWNRYRRRKLGLDDLFSDAGGTVRLNLDDYLLPPEETPVKQIGNNDK
jgi:hypothetical protein